VSDGLEGIILLSEFSFPNHYKIQEWLSGTEYHEYFDLVLCEVETETARGDKRVNRTVPGLYIKGAKDKGKFYWELKGGADYLTQKVLDFKPERVL
jgi:hypothetical protein